ncbi:fibroblast growth factor 23-like [Pholidichthys leucotaenia]
MQQAFFLLILTAIHVSVLVDCRPRLQDPEQLHKRQQPGFHTRTQAHTSAGMSYSELKGSMRQGTHRGVFVILPVRTATSNFVSIYNLRRKQFICMDTKGEQYNSTKLDSADCLFQRIWLDLVNHHDVFYSTSGNRLLKLVGGKLQVIHGKPPERTSSLLKKLLSPFVKRQRRSDEVNPSDPLRTETNPSVSGKDVENPAQTQSEQDQTGAVSKETMTSCHDPRKVLQHTESESPVKTNIAERAQQD